MTAKLHEILAVEQDLKAAAAKSLGEAKGAFGKPDLFIELSRSYAPLDDEGQKMPPEHKPMVTTVPEQLQRMQRHVAKYLDVLGQKERTNGKARADLLVDGAVLATDLPATYLLGLEARLKELRDLLSAIPILDPSEVWTWDTGKESHAAAPKETLRNEKVPQVLTKALPTKEHPAQTEVFTKDVPIGTWTNRKWSGMISAKQKRALLERCDTLARAVKQARMRANDTEVDEMKCGKDLLSYILEPLNGK